MPKSGFCPTEVFSDQSFVDLELLTRLARAVYRADEIRNAEIDPLLRIPLPNTRFMPAMDL